jgi:parallel beta-helix repeat protein
MRDLTIDGNAANGVGTDTVGIGVYLTSAIASRASVLERVTVRNARSHGIRALGAAGAPFPLIIRDCVVTSSPLKGILVRRAATRITGCVVMNNLKEGIVLAECDDSYIADNTASSNAWHGIAVTYSRGVSVASNTADNNGKLTDGTDGYEVAAGIAFEGGDPALPVNSEWTAVGNTCSGNRSHGITVDPTITDQPGKREQHGAVTGNVLRANGGHGIYAHNASFISITGNVSNSNGIDGIALNAAYATVSGNTCCGNRMGVNVQANPGATDLLLGPNLAVNNTFQNTYIAPGVPNVTTVVTQPA